MQTRFHIDLYGQYKRTIFRHCVLVYIHIHLEINFIAAKRIQHMYLKVGIFPCLIILKYLPLPENALLSIYWRMGAYIMYQKVAIHILLHAFSIHCMIEDKKHIGCQADTMMLEYLMKWQPLL